MKDILTILMMCSFHSLSKCYLQEAYRWKTLKFAFPTVEEEITAKSLKVFIPENNLPMGIDVYENRLFISIPKFRPGVLISLAYFDISDTSKSPLLHPYPNWRAHITRNGLPEIRSAYRIRVDRCSRLWILDTEVSEETEISRFNRLLIYDLHTDSLLRSYDLPPDQIQNSTFFSTIAVEDDDCEDTFVYIGDTGSPALIVFSWKKNSSWKITHEFFTADPAHDVFYIDDIPFQWLDGLYGLALSRKDSNGLANLYFHPFTSLSEYVVNTKYLKDEASKEFRKYFKFLGGRQELGQAGASFVDPLSNILFYVSVNMNSISCWNVADSNYTPKTQGIVYKNDSALIFPSDLKVDSTNTLWVLSNRFPKFVYNGLNSSEINFRIYNSSARAAVRGTRCDSQKPNPNQASKMLFKVELLLVPYLFLIYVCNYHFCLYFVFKL